MSMSCEGEKQEPWSLEALRREADEFLQTCYGLELHIPILVNRRLKRVLGRFALKGGRPFAIELSADLLQYQERHVIVDVLKHECIHYACYMLGKPYRDGAPDFERELMRHGVAKTGTYAYKGKQHLFQCVECKNVYLRHRKYATDVHGLVKMRRCGQCHGRLRYIGYGTYGSGVHVGDAHLK